MQCRHGGQAIAVEIGSDQPPCFIAGTKFLQQGFVGHVQPLKHLTIRPILGCDQLWQFRSVGHAECKRGARMVARGQEIRR